MRVIVQLVYLSKSLRRKVVFILLAFLGIYGIFYNYINSKSHKLTYEVLRSAALPGLFASLTDDIDNNGLPKVTIESKLNLYDEDDRSQTTTVIAIGGGMTSRGVVNVSTSNAAAKFQFFHTFIPSFCQTASPNYIYKFYMAFDVNDRVFLSEELATSFKRTFAAETLQLCERPRGVRTSLHLIRCDHKGNPAWAQNDAMLEAYIDHADYYYRVNDDTRSRLNKSGENVRLWCDTQVSE